MCGDCHGVLEPGLVTSGRRCNGVMEVCHNLLDMLMGLLELIGELLVGTLKFCHRLNLVGRGLAVGGGGGG